MHTFRSAICALATLILSAGVARAHDYDDYDGEPEPAAAPAPAPGTRSHHVALRKGLMLGFGLGAGGMQSKDGPIECADCTDSVAGSAGAHIGVMITPRLALMYELWGSGQALDSEATTSLVQVLSLAAMQYWVTPRVWIKGGLGTAHLVQRFAAGKQSEQIDNGVAGMAAVGVELVHKPRFAMDLQLRGGTGTYEGIEDKIHQGSLTLGFSWY